MSTLAGAFILLVVLAVFLPSKPSQVAIALDKKVAKLRAEGAPLTGEDRAKVSPHPPPERDANIVLREALAQAIPFSESPLLPLGGDELMPARSAPISREVMDAMAIELSNAVPAFEAIPTELSGISFATTFRNFTNDTLTPPFIKFRALLHTCALTALYQSELKDARKTVEALRKGWGIASTPNGDHLVSAGIRAAAVKLMFEFTEQVLNRTKLDDAELAELARLLPVEVVDQLGPAWVAERAFGTSILEMFRQRQRAHRGFRMRMAFYGIVSSFMHKKSIYRDEDYLLLLNTYEALELTQSKPLLERVRAAKLLQTNCDTNAQSAMAILVTPPLAKAVTIACEAKAQIVILRTALAVERFRLANTNASPPTLDVLVPKYCSSAPLDPFDEEPLRYRKLTHGYIVYSIGADGVDNGGSERDNKKNKAAYDLTITVER
jgi:hypothetical protein